MCSSRLRRRGRQIGERRRSAEWIAQAYIERRDIEHKRLIELKAIHRDGSNSIVEDTVSPADGGLAVAVDVVSKSESRCQILPIGGNDRIRDSRVAFEKLPARRIWIDGGLLAGAERAVLPKNFA